MWEFARKLEDSTVIAEARIDAEMYLLNKEATDADIVLSAQKLIRSGALKPSQIILSILSVYRNDGSLSARQRSVLCSKIAMYK